MRVPEKRKSRSYGAFWDNCLKFFENFDAGRGGKVKIHVFDKNIPI